MQMHRASRALLFLVATGLLVAQIDGPRLRLRSGPVPDNLLSAEPTKARALRAARTAISNRGRSHLILQFAEFPGESVRIALEARQFLVLAYVPDYSLLVSAPLDAPLEGLGAVYAGVLTLENKFSALLGRNLPDEVWSAVVDLHADVETADGRQIAGAEGLTVVENPDLPSQSLLVSGSVQQLERFAGHDEVASVYPASQDLLEGRPTLACRGGGISLDPSIIAKPLAAAANLASSFGDGWDGPGLGSASLTYSFGRLTPALDPTLTRAEITRALMAWSSVVKVSFAESFQTQRKRQLDILFADRSHGDNQDFDGRGGALAHTFYPPPNSEPIAGDLHFDPEEQWRVDNDVDVFSVALHELGHALGLGHNDDPNAVMYPYYRRATMLHQPDVLEIRKIYAAAGDATGNPAIPSSPPPAATPEPTPLPVPSVPEPPTEPKFPPPSGTDRTPPTLVITTPALATTTTRSTTYNVRGRAADDVRVTGITWTNSSGRSGKASGLTFFATGPMPLVNGQNRIVITASDAAGNTAWRTLTITRR